MEALPVFSSNQQKCELIIEELDKPLTKEDVIFMHVACNQGNFVYII